MHAPPIHRSQSFAKKEYAKIEATVLDLNVSNVSMELEPISKMALPTFSPIVEDKPTDLDHPFVVMKEAKKIKSIKWSMIKKTANVVNKETQRLESKMSTKPVVLNAFYLSSWTWKRIPLTKISA